MPPNPIWNSWYHSPFVVVARIHQVRRGRETGGTEEFRLALSEQAAEHVEDAAERVRAAGERCRIARLEQRAFGDVHLDEIVEAVVEQDLRIENHDHVDAEEHLEHVFVEIEVDRAFRLRIGARPVEHDIVAHAPHRAAQLVGAVAAPVVADVILEDELFLGDRLLDELRHRALVALESRLERGDERIHAEAVAHLDDAPLRGAAGRHDGVESRSGSSAAGGTG